MARCFSVRIWQLAFSGYRIKMYTSRWCPAFQLLGAHYVSAQEGNIVNDERYSRQSFLGPHAQERIEQAVIGIVGLGGGGSHIVQQLAHVGFQQYVLYDPDCVEDHNLNRMIGATESDVEEARPKVEVALRIIRGLQPQALVETYRKRWQEERLPLRRCDLLFGCVDGVANRRDLEASARRYLIPYIDIGLDVHQARMEPPVMAGQGGPSRPENPSFTL